MAALPRRRRKRDPEGRMPVMDHLRELRRRLIIAVLIIAAGAIVGYVFYDPILAILKHPYCKLPPSHRLQPAGTGESCTLIFTAPLDGFTARLKVSFIAGTVLTAPLWLYQIWAFITPGLRKKERKYTIWFIITSSLLFVAGVALAYIVLSKGLSVLVGSAGSGTAAALTVTSYLGFVTMMLLVFGASFEVPLLVVLANFAGILPSRLLRKFQRIAIFLIFLFAAIATPSTDPFTMIGMAVPMCVLFEVAVVVCVVHDRRKAQRKAAQQTEELGVDEPSTIDPIPETVSDATWTDST